MGSSWCGVSISGRMVIDMNKTQVRTLEQVGQVLWGTEALHAGAATSFTRSA